MSTFSPGFYKSASICLIAVISIGCSKNTFNVSKKPGDPKVFTYKTVENLVSTQNPDEQLEQIVQIAPMFESGAVNSTLFWQVISLHDAFVHSLTDPIKTELLSLYRFGCSQESFESYSNFLTVVNVWPAELLTQDRKCKHALSLGFRKNYVELFLKENSGVSEKEFGHFIVTESEYDEKLYGQFHVGRYGTSDIEFTGSLEKKISSLLGRDVSLLEGLVRGKFINIAHLYKINTSLAESLVEVIAKNNLDLLIARSGESYELQSSLIKKWITNSLPRDEFYKEFNLNTQNLARLAKEHDLVSWLKEELVSGENSKKAAQILCDLLVNPSMDEEFSRLEETDLLRMTELIGNDVERAERLIYAYFWSPSSNIFSDQLISLLMQNQKALTKMVERYGIGFTLKAFKKLSYSLLKNSKTDLAHPVVEVLLTALNQRVTNSKLSSTDFVGLYQDAFSVFSTLLSKEEPQQVLIQLERLDDILLKLSAKQKELLVGEIESGNDLVSYWIGIKSKLSLHGKLSLKPSAFQLIDNAMRTQDWLQMLLASRIQMYVDASESRVRAHCQLLESFGVPRRKSLPIMNADKLIFAPGCYELSGISEISAKEIVMASDSVILGDRNIKLSASKANLSTFVLKELREHPDQQSLPRDPTKDAIAFPILVGLKTPKTESFEEGIQIIPLHVVYRKAAAGESSFGISGGQCLPGIKGPDLSIQANEVVQRVNMISVGGKGQCSSEPQIGGSECESVFETNKIVKFVKDINSGFERTDGVVETARPILHNRPTVYKIKQLLNEAVKENGQTLVLVPLNYIDALSQEQRDRILSYAKSENLSLTLFLQDRALPKAVKQIVEQVNSHKGDEFYTLEMFRGGTYLEVGAPSAVRDGDGVQGESGSVIYEEKK